MDLLSVYLHIASYRIERFKGHSHWQFGDVFIGATSLSITMYSLRTLSMSLGITTNSLRTLSIMSLGITTYSLRTLSIMSISITKHISRHSA